MRLYHVSFDVEDDTCFFYPRVPSAGLPCENRIKKRICFSSSIEKCFQAMPRDNCNMKVGQEVIIYHIDVDNDDKYVRTPEDLYLSGDVEDALINQEYWYLRPIELRGERKTIRSFEASHDLHFEILTSNDIFVSLKDYFKTGSLNVNGFNWETLRGKTAEKTYSNIIDYAMSIEDYDLVDNLEYVIGENVTYSHGLTFHRVLLD